MSCSRPIPRSSVGLALAALALLTALLIPARSAAATERSDEQEFVSLINELRTSQGLQPLTVHAELLAGARAWTQVVADAGAIRHANDLSIGITVRWALLGENVGVTSRDVRAIFDAFVASPTHYKNLVEPGFDHIGVGVVYGADGRIYTVHRFMDLVGSDPAPAVEPEPPADQPAPEQAVEPAPVPDPEPATQPAPATQPESAAQPAPVPDPEPNSDPERWSRFADLQAELELAGI